MVELSYAFTFCLTTSLNVSIFCLRFIAIRLGRGCNKLLCLLLVASLQVCNNQTQDCKLW